MTKKYAVSATVLVLACLIAQGCSRNELDWHTEPGFRWAELNVPPKGRTGFMQLSAGQSGIRFENSLTEDQILANHILLNGSGVAVGDIDGDGWCDLYFCRLNGNNVLYRNVGNWQFKDITQTAGVGCPDRFSAGATFADVDGDNDLDLLVTAPGGPNACFRNDGTGKFTEVTESAGLSPKPGRTGSTTMALADIEGDGDLDLYIANYKRISVKDQHSPQYTSTGLILSRTDYGEPDLLYLNDGQGHFTAAKLTAEVLYDENGKPVSWPRDWSLMARLQDMDEDGDPDLYVCNDFLSPDGIWRNDGTGKFHALPSLAVRSTSASSMAVDFSDLDRDGDLDFFVVDMLSRDHKRRKTQIGDMAPTPVPIGKIDSRPQIPRNVLLLNRGDNTYAEIANYAGVEASEWSWSTLFLDVDLDGYEDILVTNGHVYDVQDADTQRKIQNLRVRNLEELRRTLLMYPRLATPNSAFRNRGDLTFEEISAPWGLAATGISHGMATADLDNDGDADLVMNNYEAPAGIYRNETVVKRVAVRLKGLAPNTKGIGAKIKLLGVPVPQTKELICGGMYLSGSDPQAVFAASPSKTMQIEVTWRSGKRSVVENAGPNRIYEIDESHAVPPPSDRLETPLATQQSNHISTPAVTYFEDVSHLLSHRHYETPFNDFHRQPLLPNRLSQLGPGVAWFDLDDDHDDDLIIAGGRGGQLACFTNEGKAGFKATSITGLAQPAKQDQTTTLGMRHESGRVSLLVGNSNFEDLAQRTPAVTQYDFRNGRYMTPREFSAELSATGPMALGDYDGDGDLDLFVGGRMIPGRYPEPASAKLWLNHQGQFIADRANAKSFDRLGLVSGAVFSDFDDDGDADLILAVEWGAITIFENEASILHEATAKFGLAGYKGWWNGVTTGDLDEDGRLDIIATNWGLNSKYHTTAGHPLQIYYADFDRNGQLDIVEAHFDTIMKALVPERGLSSMSQALLYIRANMTSHEKYGGSEVQEIIGAGLGQAGKLEANTLAHTVFFNRGDRFDATPLPPEAQFAPAFHVSVTDFDGDGHEDLFLSQNFFSSQIETPRLDAGRGLWLKGDGSGKLAPVPGQITGVKVYGEQRGAALSDFDNDGRVDMVITQNGAETKLYRNVRGKPGLRVRLAGVPQNPNGVGATVQLQFKNRKGPAREIHAGAGYWSQDSATLILGTPQPPERIHVRWPGGKLTDAKIPRAVREVTVKYTGELVVKRSQ
jgi:hypothetical protein